MLLRVATVEVPSPSVVVQREPAGGRRPHELRRPLVDRAREDEDYSVDIAYHADKAVHVGRDRGPRVREIGDAVPAHAPGDPKHLRERPRGGWRPNQAQLAGTLGTSPAPLRTRATSALSRRAFGSLRWRSGLGSWAPRGSACTARTSTLVKRYRPGPLALMTLTSATRLVVALRSSGRAPRPDPSSTRFPSVPWSSSRLRPHLGRWNARRRKLTNRPPPARRWQPRRP